MHWTVVARYTEDTSWLDQLRDLPETTILVLNKGGGGEGVQLENVGREAHSFAFFCAEWYDKLHDDDIVSFVQGYPFDHCPDAIAKISDPEFTGPLGKNLVCDFNGWPHHPGLNVQNAWQQLCQIFNLDAASGRSIFSFCAGAQCQISAKRILQYDQSCWENLVLVLGREYAFDVHDHDGIDPWQMERFWHALF